MSWESVLDHIFVLKNIFSCLYNKEEFGLISNITLSLTCQKGISVSNWVSLLYLYYFQWNLHLDTVWVFFQVTVLYYKIKHPSIRREYFLIFTTFSYIYNIFLYLQYFLIFRHLCSPGAHSKVRSLPWKGSQHWQSLTLYGFATIRRERVLSFSSASQTMCKSTTNVLGFLFYTPHYILQLWTCHRWKRSNTFSKGVSEAVTTQHPTRLFHSVNEDFISAHLTHLEWAEKKRFHQTGAGLSYETWDQTSRKPPEKAGLGRQWGIAFLILPVW